MIQHISPKDARGRTISLEPISKLLDLILGKWQPTAIWLFGSRARGEARPDSDWDLLVLVPDNEQDVDDVMATWLVTKKAHVPADVILCRSSEFEDARETPNTLAYEASHFGVPIHGF